MTSISLTSLRKPRHGWEKPDMPKKSKTPPGIGRVLGRGPSRRFGFIKLLGKSKRWRNESNPNFAADATISDRTMSGLAREERLGERVSKEKFTRGVREGRYEHIDQDRQARASQGQKIRKEIPEIAPRDAAVIIKFRPEGGYDALDDGEKERFDDLFKRYDKGAVREALGSPKRRSNPRRRPNNERTVGGVSRYVNVSRKNAATEDRMSYDIRKRFMLDDEHWAQIISVPVDLEFPPDEMAKLETWSDLREWLKKQYDRRRDSKRRDDNPSGPSGRRINARPRKGGPFVAVDSEGINVGEPIVKGKGKDKKTYQKQRTVLMDGGRRE